MEVSTKKNPLKEMQLQILMSLKVTFGSDYLRSTSLNIASYL